LETYLKTGLSGGRNRFISRAKILFFKKTMWPCVYFGGSQEHSNLLKNSNFKNFDCINPEGQDGTHFD